jgi:hypothetical protein
LEVFVFAEFQVAVLSSTIFYFKTLNVRARSGIIAQAIKTFHFARIYLGWLSVRLILVAQ